METMQIELTRLFVKVVEHNSFSKAAEVLRIPKSTLSKAVTKLEKLTGTKLIIRSTRSQTLTAAGRVFYETCLEPVRIIEEAQKSLYGQDTIISGVVKITAAEDIGNYLITPIIGELCLKYPNLKFDMTYTNDIVDMIKDGYDLAVRIGHLRENRLKAKKLGMMELIPVASPRLFKTSHESEIRHPKDLARFNCLSVTGPSISKHWKLISQTDNIEIPINTIAECNHMTSLLNLAKSGIGVVLAPSFLCSEYLKNKSLVRILPNWWGQGMPISLLSTVSFSSSARIKIASDAIAEFVKQALE